ncbi:MAG: hypothetical protein R3C03_24305 [Pirellulaceae bacterium]
MKIFAATFLALAGGLFYATCPTQEEARVQETRATNRSSHQGQVIVQRPGQTVEMLNLNYTQPARVFQNDPIQDELRQALGEYSKAESEDQKREIRDRVREALEERYDEFLDQQNTQIDDLEKRIKELREQLSRRRDAKERMVDLKLEMVLSQAEGLGWPEANALFFGRYDDAFGGPNINTANPFPQPPRAIAPNGPVPDNRNSNLTAPVRPPNAAK